MRRPYFLLPAVVLLLAQACDDSDSSNGGHVAPSVDAGTADASSPHAGHDAATPDEEDSGTADAAPKPVGDCSDADFAANTVTDGGAVEVAFPTSAGPVQYTNRCITVKAGSTVTFTGSFLQHPLEPGAGDSPNPIPYTAENQTDDKLALTFPNAGTFGYFCEYHPSLMYGAVRVVP